MPILDRFSLRGRVALITAGAGPLFGSSISTGLAEAGATVITASRSLDRNQEFAAGLRAAGHDAVGMEFEPLGVLQGFLLRGKPGGLRRVMEAHVNLVPLDLSHLPEDEE